MFFTRRHTWKENSKESRADYLDRISPLFENKVLLEVVPFPQDDG